MAPSVPSSTTHYALVVDAGSSGSRLQIYSWRDPGLERDEILSEVRAARKAGLGDGTSQPANRWWWWDSIKGKGKGKVTAEEMERRALRRLVRVGKGVKGDDWVKRVEPGELAFSHVLLDAQLRVTLTLEASRRSRRRIYRDTWRR